MHAHTRTLTTILKVSRDPLCVRDVILNNPPALSCSALAVFTAAPSLPTSVSPNTDEAHDDIVRLGPFAAAAAAKAKARGVGVASCARERRARWARRALVMTAVGGGVELVMCRCLGDVEVVIAHGARSVFTPLCGYRLGFQLVSGGFIYRT